jgi:hypothetical protein
MKNKIATVAVFIMAFVPVFYAFKMNPKVEELTLKQALAKGYITCAFENNKGYTHYHKCLIAKLSNTSNRVLTVKIDNGTQVNPQDSDYQNLIVTENLFVTLNPGDKKNMEINAMCTESHDAAPGSSPMAYTLANDATGVMKALTTFIAEKKYQNSEGQMAVWSVANNSDIGDISGYDTTAARRLQELICKYTGKKMPPPPAPTDYRRNYYAPPATIKVTFTGEFEYSFAKARNILIGMFDKNNVLVRELYKKDGETPGAHKQTYTFDASVYTDTFYFIRLVADGQVRLESKVEM